MQLVLDLGQLFRKNFRFSHARVNFFFKNLCPALKYLDVLRLALIAYAVALVVGHDALRTDVYVIVFTEVLGLLVGMLWAELFSHSVFVFFLLLRGHVLL